MSIQKVIIIGSSGHSKVIIDIFEKSNTYEIVGLIDSFRNRGEETLGYKILGTENDLPALISKYPNCKLFIAIGDNWIRSQIAEKITCLVSNADFANAIHPSAIIGKNVTLGKGVAIMAGAIINSDSSIGDFAIINTKASIDHDCHLANYVSLAPNATLGGSVNIDSFSVLSISATISHGLSVGKHTIIGAGALLMKNCGSNLIMYGIPAKEIKGRNIGEKYL